MRIRQREKKIIKNWERDREGQEDREREIKERDKKLEKIGREIESGIGRQRKRDKYLKNE